MAHVTLVRPPFLGTRWELTVDATPPISLAYLAGYLRALRHDVSVIDAVGEALERGMRSCGRGLLTLGLTPEEIVARIPPGTDLVGVSAMFSVEWPFIREIIGRIRERFPSLPIVLGGEHATAQYEFSLRNCPALDVAALGEGELTLADLAVALTEGRPLDSVPGIAFRQGAEIVRTAPRPRIRDIDGLPEPAWELTPLPKYLDRGLAYGVERGRTIPMLASRGCPFECTFCSNPAMWTTRWLARNPARVVDEIERHVARYDIDSVDFYDLTAIVRKDWIIEFCEELMRRGVRVDWQLPSGTRSEALDEDVIPLLRKAGCSNLTYAPESGSDRMLKLIKKKVKLPRMMRSIEAALAAGINVKVTLIMGFPDETWSDVWRTFRFIVSLALRGVHDVSVWAFVPYPGSELFTRLVQERRLHPETDDYFLSLAAYADVSKTRSWSQHIGSRTLMWLRIAAFVLFYGLSFTLRPARLYAVARNLVSGRHQSKLESRLAALARKVAT